MCSSIPVYFLTLYTSCSHSHLMFTFTPTEHNDAERSVQATTEAAWHTYCDHYVARDTRPSTRRTAQQDTRQQATRVTAIRDGSRTALSAVARGINAMRRLRLSAVITARPGVTEDLPRETGQRCAPLPPRQSSIARVVAK
jgi:hypothetical protein